MFTAYCAKVLLWPEKSPDLNLTKNLCLYIKERVRAGQKMTNILELKNTVLQVDSRNSNLTERVCKYVWSILDKIAAVIVDRDGRANIISHSIGHQFGHMCYHQKVTFLWEKNKHR